MHQFEVKADGQYLNRSVKGFYHIAYTGYGNLDNPNYLNDLKNTFNNARVEKLQRAVNELLDVLKLDLPKFDTNLVICLVPRSKAETSYTYHQLLFKKVVQHTIQELGFIDGSDYIVRHTDTKTTHLAHTLRGAPYAGNGEMPYPGITRDTCTISKGIKGKDILLIDDIYTSRVYIDEDVIQTLFDSGANTVKFYAVGRTI